MKNKLFKVSTSFLSTILLILMLAAAFHTSSFETIAFAQQLQLPAIAGKSIYYADSGAPVLGTAGTATTGIANQLWYTQIFIPVTTTVTNLSVLCGTTCTTDKIASGLWSTAGVLIAVTAGSAGNGTTLSGASTWQTIALQAPTVLVGPAKYIIGTVTSGTTAADIQTAPLLGGVCAVSTGMTTLATFTPVTTTTTNSCPFMYVN